MRVAVDVLVLATLFALTVGDQCVDEVDEEWCKVAKGKYGCHGFYGDRCPKTCDLCKEDAFSNCEDEKKPAWCMDYKRRMLCNEQSYRNVCLKTCEGCKFRSQFPLRHNITSTWSWANDGTNENGVVELLADGSVTWRGGEKQGNWKFNNERTVLETTFNGVHHKLHYDGVNAIAILISPVRNQFSTMSMVSIDPLSLLCDDDMDEQWCRTVKERKLCKERHYRCSKACGFC